MSKDKDDILEKSLDDFIEFIRENYKEDDRNHVIINKNEYDKVKFVYEVMKRIGAVHQSNVTYEINKPFVGMGSVTVEGTDLLFDNTEWFARAAEFASNIEIYPMKRGSVKVTFTFHGLAGSV